MKKLFKKIGVTLGGVAPLFMAMLVNGCADENVANGVSEETSIAENITSLKGLVLRSLASFDLENLDSTTVNSGNFGSSLYLKKVRFCTLDSKTLATGNGCFDGTVNENSSYEVKIESNGWRYGLLEVDVSDFDESRLLELGYTEELLEQSRYKMHAVIDAKNPTASNVNILTAWKYYQVKKLVESGASVESAMAQAEEDVLASIGIYGEYENFGRMDVYGNSKSDHLLLAATYLMDIPSISDNNVVACDMRKFVRNNEIHNDPFWLSLGLEKPSDEITDQVERFVTNYFSVYANLGRCDESNEGKIVLADEHDFVNAASEMKKYGLGLKCSDGLWGWYVPEVEHSVGTMTDSRDGRVYKTTSFTVNGSVQTWMAEDLKFDVPGSKCLNDSLGLCEKYGRLYTWPSVMQLDTAGFVEEVSEMLESVDAQNHQGVCPDGWRIPSSKDWKLLAEYIGDDDHLAAKLMKKDTWIGAKIRLADLGRFDLYNRASDVIEFSAVPNISYGREGRYASIPSFEESDNPFDGIFERIRSLDATIGGMNVDEGILDDEGEFGLIGVRCVKK